MSQKCFVCNNVAYGQVFRLPSYHLKHSKLPFVEKLAKMLGEKHVVVCGQDDILCQSCATTMETLDRLEHESSAAKEYFGKFFGKKYHFALDNIPQSTSVSKENKQNGQRLGFAAQKRKSEEDIKQLSQEVNNDPRSQIMLKCSTCKYTTSYTEFEHRHLSKFVKKRKLGSASGSKCIKSEKDPLSVETETFLRGNVILEVGDPNQQDYDEDGEVGARFQIVGLPKNGNEVFTLINGNENMQVVWEDVDNSEEL